MEEDQSDEDYDWSIYDKEDTAVHLEGKDYIALFIASLETIFLPLVIIIILLFVISITLSILF
jgi:hypothetical protein